MKHNKLLLAVLAIIIVGEAAATGLLPVSRGHLFTLLTAKAGAIWAALFLYFFNYFAVDLFQSLKGYVVLKVSLWYRTLRTEQMSDYIGNMQACIPEFNLVSNAPQRIQEDIKLSYLARITVWVEYAISGIILMQLFLLNLSEPTLIGFALVYAAISVAIAYRFNPRLTLAEISAQQAEASFRTSLVDRITDIGLLSPTNDTLMKAARIRTEYLLFTKLQLGLIAVLPYAVLLPKLLSGTIDLGQVVQHQATFALIVVNAAVLIQLYTTLIQGKASEQRVKEIL